MEIPSLAGRIAVVTGANSGLGLATAKQLAAHGARVVLACRDTVKGAAALEQVRAAAPQGSAELEQLDLASLDSVEEFAARVSSGTGAAAAGLDLLVNNAGVMAPPRRHTADGFELQLGTNHLGHFALTGRLLKKLEGRPDARVVTLSSNAHRFGRINFDDLQSESAATCAGSPTASRSWRT